MTIENSSKKTSKNKPVVKKIGPPDLGKIRLAESSLEDYSYAIMKGESNSLKEFAIETFFDKTPYATTSLRSQSSYDHNKLQYVMKDFFASKGFEIIRETNYGYSHEIPVIHIDVEYDDNKFFKAYKDANIFMWREKDGQKVVVDIGYDAHISGYTYYINGSGDIENLFQQWEKLAKEKNFYKGKKIDCSCKFLKLAGASWDDVILEESKKNLIQTNAASVFDDISLYKKFNISIKRGIILHGPPGSGKTCVVRAIANGSSCSVVYALPQDFDPRRGGVRQVCSIAKDLAPCILIIEDIDWIAKDRNEGHAALVMELMNQLDGLETFGDIVTIGTTNSANSIEKAVKNRPGRFDRIIEIGNPSEDCRLKMIHLFSKKWIIDNVDTKTLAAKTEGLSGAHIRDLCVTAAMFAVREKSISEDTNSLIVTSKHFKEAIKEVKRKDFTTYQQTQNERDGKIIGFGSGSNGRSIFDDDFDL